MMTGKKKRQLRGGGSYALKVLIGLLFISPMIIGLLFSFQSDSQLGAAPLRLITENPTIENYIEVFRKVPLLRYHRRGVRGGHLRTDRVLQPGSLRLRVL